MRGRSEIQVLRQCGCIIAAVAALVAPGTVPPVAGAPAALEAVRGVTEDGEATGLWLTMIRKRSPGTEPAGLTAKAPLTDAQGAWAQLIGSKVASWEIRRGDLVVPYAPVAPPERVLIVMGNRGGDDAFTHDETTIGFDLSVLQSAYGDAPLPGNAERLDRFFDHEYTHLMQKAWLAVHPYEAASPLRVALLDIWLEGLGNHRSLSGRWRATAGQPSETARGVLAVLEPRFAARMSALACASPDRVLPLMEDLSRGRFESKWGALPAALWLETEASRDPEAIRSFVLAGPDGVWDLAARHLPESLRGVIEEARRAASMCADPAAVVAPTLSEP